MRAINPFTQQPLGSELEISRCRPAGSVVSARDYNALERNFCRDQALNPGMTRVFGPFRATDAGDWWLTAGQAIFDRMTGHFIGCASAQLLAPAASKSLLSAVTNGYTTAALIREDGIVIAGAGWDELHATKPVHVNQTGFVDETTFQALISSVDWGKNWTKPAVMKILANNIQEFSDRLVSAYPIPAVPEEYEASYRPEHYVIFSIGGAVFDVVEEVQLLIDSKVRSLIVFSVSFGCVGFLVLLLIILAVSWLLTSPLEWIEAESQKIISSFENWTENDDKKAAADWSRSGMMRPPHTEVDELVSEFQRLIKGFSGQGSSSLSKPQSQEIANLLSRHKEYGHLYLVNKGLTDDGRLTPTLPSGLQGLVRCFRVGSTIDEDSPSFRALFFTRSNTPTTDHSGSRDFESTISWERSNLGQNVLIRWDRSQLEQNEPIRAIQSSIFWWIVTLIVLPLLVIIVVICAVVANDVNAAIPSLISVSEPLSIQVELNSLIAAAELRAAYTEAVIREPLRNLHFVTRVAGWLLFDSIARRLEALPSVQVGWLEECKNFPNNYSCPFFSNDRQSPCSCDWKDTWDKQCRRYEDTDPRQLQHPWYFCQERDANPMNGNRFTSKSFPQHGTSPESTLWWKNVSELPGSWKGSNASGYDTAYDRLRVGSAMSVAYLPIYNYVHTAKNLNARVVLAAFLASALDGSFIGYSGCNYDWAQMSHFVSSESNSAGVNLTELCPLGKYGYDPRCRPWYTAAVRSSTPVSVSPSFPDAPSDVGTGSLGSLLVDPRTGKLVGQTLIAFSPSSLSDRLQKETTSILYFVISPDSIDGKDTVFATNYSFGNNPKPIVDLVVPFDAEGTNNRAEFDSIVEKMKNGSKGFDKFRRSTVNGSQEVLIISYAPVYGRLLQPIQANKYSEGNNASKAVMFSLAIARREDSIKDPFTKKKIATETRLRKISWLLPCLVVSVSFISVVFMLLILHSITSPFLMLLLIIKKVNAGRFDDDIPPLKGGSREVNQVYNTFAKLYRIVRVSTMVFFSGNRDWAYQITNDALRLFHKLKDRKAIGIASNNLGNILLALRQEHSFLQHSCYLVGGACCINQAYQHYTDAIAIAVEDYEKQSSNDIKADYALQLANRHFNRGMFFVHCAGHSCIPDNARDLGHTDLLRAQELDRLIREYWMHERQLLKKSDIYFDLLLRRLHGLAMMRTVEKHIWDIWDINIVIDEIVQLLLAAWDSRSAPIFQEISRIGRLQQLEGALINAGLNAGQIIDAAYLAARMLVEDEYIIEPSLVLALEAMFEYLRGNNFHPPRSGPTIQPVALVELEQQLKRCKNFPFHCTSRNKCLVFCIELTDQLVDLTMLNQINYACLKLYDEYCGNGDYVGIVASTLSMVMAPSCLSDIGYNASMEADTYSQLNECILPWNINESERQQQRQFLDAVTRNLCQASSRTLFRGIQKLLVSGLLKETSMEYYLILITDGSSWDAGDDVVLSHTIPSLFHSMNAEATSTSDQSSTASIRPVVHLVIIGTQLQDPKIISDCTKFVGMVTNQSFFLNCSTTTTTTTTITRDAKTANWKNEMVNIEIAFDRLTTLISSRDKMASTRIQLGTSMEKF